MSFLKEEGRGGTTFLLIAEYKQLKVMLQVNLLYSFHALCCKIKM